MIHTVQRPGVCSAVYGKVNYKEPLKSFDKVIVLTSDFLLSQYCYDCTESDVKQYSLTH